MHLEYFGLAKPPFAEEPDTEIFFPEADRTALLRRIYADLQNGRPVIRLTGAEGSGKTMLCLLLAHLLPTEFQSVYLHSPAGSFDELLRAACQELGQQPQPDMSTWLRRQLEQLHAQGKKLLLLIDQAELMFPAALERLLRTVFAEGQAALQVILASSPALNDRVSQLEAYCPDMKIPPDHQLALLTEEEQAAYLSFRLKAAGLSAADSGKTFSSEAVRKIFKLAKGNLRTAHLLADTALQRVCAADRYFPVLAADVTALENASSGRPGRKKAALSGSAWKLLAAAVLLLFAVLLFRYSDALRRSGEDAAKKMVSTAPPVKPTELLPEKIRLNSEPQLPPEPEKEAEEEPASEETAAEAVATSAASASDEPPQISAVPVDMQEQSAPPKEEEQEQSPEEELLETPPAEPPPAAPAVQPQPAPEKRIIELAPGMRKTKAKPKSTPAAPPLAEAAEGATPPAADQLYQELLAAGSLMKNSRGKGRCTIQLLSLASQQDAAEKIKEMIVRDEYLEHRSRLKILHRPSSPAAIFVFYGSYASMEEAQAAVDNMPLFLRKHHPYALPVPDALLKTGN